MKNLELEKDPIAIALQTLSSEDIVANFNEILKTAFYPNIHVGKVCRIYHAILIIEQAKGYLEAPQILRLCKEIGWDWRVCKILLQSANLNAKLNTRQRIFLIKKAHCTFNSSLAFNKMFAHGIYNYQEQIIKKFNYHNQPADIKMQVLNSAQRLVSFKINCHKQGSL